MKQSLISILLIAFAISCHAQWRDAGFGSQVLAFGVHDSNVFVSDVPGTGTQQRAHYMYRYAPGSPTGWYGADNGLDPTQGMVTSFASLGNYVFAGMMLNGGPERLIVPLIMECIGRLMLGDMYARTGVMSSV